MDDEKVYDVVIPTLKPLSEVEPLIVELIRTAGILIRVHATCNDVSAAKNRNAGLDKCTSDIVWEIDDDMCGFPHGWALRMLHVMESNPKCAMCSPRLMRPDGGFGIMVGNPHNDTDGLKVIAQRELPTSCIAHHNTDVRFHEGYIGSTLEGNDFCRQLFEKFKYAEFICINDLLLVKTGEPEQTSGPNYDNDAATFHRRWRSK